MSSVEIAEAFCSHRFEEILDHLSDDVVWNLVGSARLEGRIPVMAACRRTASDNQHVTTTWLRFVSAGEGDVVAVDAIGRYAGPDGVTAVSSADIYEFEAGQVRTITSYAVEVDPEQPYAGPAAP